MDLRSLFESYGETLAVIGPDGREHSYQSLLAQVDEMRARLPIRERGLILLEAHNNLACLAVYLLGLFGEHVVLLCPPDRPEMRESLSSAFSPDVIVRSASLKGALEFERGTGSNQPLHRELAVMLSTSGSTGSTKCVRLSQANLLANAMSIAEYLQIGSDERGLANLPIFYSYGLSVVNSHLVSGAAALLIEHSVIDPEFWHYAKVHGATSFQGVPYVYELLDRVRLAEQAPPSLRYFTQAGGRLPPERATRYAQLAREHGWRFYVMYGQTEATARMAYLPPESTLAAPDAIGRPIPGGSFSLKDEHGALIDAPGISGELIYSGANVMMGYATERSDLGLPAGPPELATGDLAMLRPDGFYQITGRLSRFVKIFGNRIALDEVERHLEREGLPGVATGVDGTLLVATLGAGTEAAIRERLKTYLKLTNESIQVVELSEYPRLPSGKVDYSALKAMMVHTPQRSHGNGVDRAGRVFQVFQEVFGDAALDEQATFLSLGGDSLNFLHVALALEDVLGALPENWEQIPVGDLIALARSDRGPLTKAKTRTALRFAANLDTVRGLACLMVVAFHVIGQDSGLHLPETSPWRVSMASLDFVRMPFFTALAGFFYAMMPVNPDKAPTFLWRKAQSLILPAIIVGLITWALHIVQYRQPESILPVFFGGYLHLWFLFSLMWMFVLVVLMEGRGQASTFLWLAVGGACLFTHLFLPGNFPWGIDGALSLMPYFAFGVLLNRVPALRENLSLAVLCAAAGVIFLVAQLAGVVDTDPVEAKDRFIKIAAGLPAILALFSLVPRMPLLALIGTFSFTIYLWHPIANGAVRAALSHAGVMLPTWAAFLIGMTAGTAIPILLREFLRLVQRQQSWMRVPTLVLTGA